MLTAARLEEGPCLWKQRWKRIEMYEPGYNFAVWVHGTASRVARENSHAFP